jgi:hypothetical protein
MKNFSQHIILFFVCLFVCSFSAQAQLLNETFEGTTFPPTGWIKQIGANGLGTTFNWGASDNTVLGFTKETLTFLEGSGAGTFEKWLVTPQLTPNTTNNILSFKARRSGTTPLFSKLIVRVSTTSQTSHASFTQVVSYDEGFTPMTPPNTITTTKSTFTVDLSAYNNQNIYIAFVWQGTSGGNGVYLDDVKDIPLTPTNVPIMSVKGNGNAISNGSTSTAVNNNTYFGVATIGSTNIEKTFTIENTGTSALNLTSSPIVNITGTGASAYSVTQVPTSPVVTAGSTTFKITLSTASQGVKNATVSIANNTTTTNPYTFAIQGVIDGPNLALFGNSNTISNGATTTSATNDTNFGSLVLNTTAIEKTYTIQSTGDGLNLTGNPIVALSGTDASMFTVTQQPALTTNIADGLTTTFKISFNPTSLGTKTATVSIASNSGINNPYTFAIGATVTTPTIDIKGNNNAIANGSTTIATSNNTDFGNTKLTLFTEKVFTILNTGNAVLNVNNVQLSGTNASDFSVSVQPNATVNANTSTTFTVKFSPTGSVGSKTATVTVNSNSNTNASYTFAIGGVATDPPVATINVTGNSNNIASGSTTITTSNNTDFGTVQATLTGSKTFNIQNTGDATLTLSGNPLVSLSGTHASEFAVSAQPNASINAASNSSFTISFNPITVGSKTATVTITSNSSTNATYTFAIGGMASNPPTPIMAVRGNNNNINNGSTSISTTNNTDFGSAQVSTDVEKTFTILNTGDGTLTMTGNPLVQITGTDASAFTVSQAPNASINNVVSTSFKIKMNSSTAGTKNATVTLTSNSNNVAGSTYTFAIGGTVTPPPAPIITVKGNNTMIANGSTSPSTTNHTNFGNWSLNTVITRTFTIENTGNASLSITGVTLSGTDASAFTITQQPATSLGAGGTTTFTVSHTPTQAVIKNATVNIANNSAVNPFTFAIRGSDVALSVAPRLSVGKLEVYPNPAKNMLTISLENNQQKEVDVTLFDAQGKTCLTHTLPVEAGKAYLGLQGVTTGLHFLRVQVGKDWVIEKIVVE